MINKTYIAIGIIGILLGLFISRFFNQPDGSTHPAAFYERLDKQNDSLKQANALFKLKFNILNKEVDSLCSLTESGKEKVIYIKQKSNEKYQAIGNYSNNELYVYFANFKVQTDSRK